MDEWINVGEKLPPEGVGVLLCVAGRVQYGYRRSSPGCGKPYHGTYRAISGTVTHWMLLPDPPKANP